MIGYIYLTENLIDGKRYIGKKTKSMFDPNYLGSGKILLKAIKKYGKENFICKVLCECDTLEELNASEIRLIKEYNAVESPDFYNLALGGQGGSPLKGKKRITNGIIGKTIYPDEEIPEGFWYGVPPISEEHGKHISEAKKGKPCGSKGYTWYTNGKVDTLAAECPDGYWKGKTTGRCAGIKMYTNGTETIGLYDNDVIPEGFYKGIQPDHIYCNIKGRICYTDGKKHIYLPPD